MNQLRHLSCPESKIRADSPDCLVIPVSVTFSTSTRPPTHRACPADPSRALSPLRDVKSGKCHQRYVSRRKEMREKMNLATLATFTLTLTAMMMMTSPCNFFVNSIIVGE